MTKEATRRKARKESKLKGSKALTHSEWKTRTGIYTEEFPKMASQRMKKTISKH